MQRRLRHLTELKQQGAEFFEAIDDGSAAGYASVAQAVLANKELELVNDVEQWLKTRMEQNREKEIADAMAKAPLRDILGKFNVEVKVRYSASTAVSDEETAELTPWCTRVYAWIVQGEAARLDDDIEMVQSEKSTKCPLTQALFEHPVIK